jgi:hypothetical protein
MVEKEIELVILRDLKHLHFVFIVNCLSITIISSLINLIWIAVEVQNGKVSGATRSDPLLFYSKFA